MNITRESKWLDPDLDRRFVGPDLGPKCLQSKLTENHYYGKI